MTVLWLLSSIILPWVKMPGPYYTPSKFDHYFVMIGTWLFNLLRVAQLNEELLEDRELARQATNLNFVSLVDATCTNSVDEARIRQSISGFERDVELAIHILMKAGAYDHSLRKAFESGANIRGLGTTDLVVKTGVAYLAFYFCMVFHPEKIGPFGPYGTTYVTCGFIFLCNYIYKYIYIYICSMCVCM